MHIYSYVIINKKLLIHAKCYAKKYGKDSLQHFQDVVLFVLLK